MPTIFIFFGFRFMFYSNDHEPIHVHVIKDGNEAKYNVSPLTQIYNHGFKKHDIALIESIISENEAVIIDRWKEYFFQKECLKRQKIADLSFYFEFQVVVAVVGFKWHWRETVEKADLRSGNAFKSLPQRNALISLFNDVGSDFSILHRS